MTFLKECALSRKSKERFLNPGIIPFILKNRPEVVVWFSFQPTVIIALLCSRLIK